jgi:hypothetical protein
VAIAIGSSLVICYQLLVNCCDEVKGEKTQSANGRLRKALDGTPLVDIKLISTRADDRKAENGNSET